MLALLFPLLLAVSPSETAPVKPRTADLGTCTLRQPEPVMVDGKAWLVFDCPQSGAIVLQPAENFQVPEEE